MIWLLGIGALIAWGLGKRISDGERQLNDATMGETLWQEVPLDQIARNLAAASHLPVVEGSSIVHTTATATVALQLLEMPPPVSSWVLRRATSLGADKSWLAEVQRAMAYG